MLEQRAQDKVRKAIDTNAIEIVEGVGFNYSSELTINSQNDPKDSLNQIAAARKTFRSAYTDACLDKSISFITVGGCSDNISLRFPGFFRSLDEHHHKATWASKGWLEYFNDAFPGDFYAKYPSDPRCVSMAITWLTIAHDMFEKILNVIEDKIKEGDKFSAKATFTAYRDCLNGPLNLPPIPAET